MDYVQYKTSNENKPHYDGMHEEGHEVAIIILPDTVIDERTVVVKLAYAVVAVFAVARALRAIDLTGFAESSSLVSDNVRLECPYPLENFSSWDDTWVSEGCKG
jgi:hypothetical protein